MGLTLIFAVVTALACAIVLIRTGKNYLNDLRRARQRHIDTC